MQAVRQGGQRLHVHVPDGQILGYIGPNGAGKSTTIKILSGILRPDRGECTVDGLVPWEDRKRHRSEERRVGKEC